MALEMAGAVASTWLADQERDLGLAGEPSAFQKWLGPISKSLTLASGIFQGAQLLKASGSYRDQYRQYRQMAAQALEEGFQTGIDIERQGQEVLGTMTAAFGKSGSLLEGSPLLVLADTTARIQQNVERVIQQGRIEQLAYLRAARRAKKAASSATLGGIGKIAGLALSMVPGLQPLGLGLGGISSIPIRTPNIPAPPHAVDAATAKRIRQRFGWGD